MNTGRTLESLAKELTRQRDSRYDLIVPTPVMRMHTNGKTNLNIEVKGKNQQFGVNEWAHGQLAQYLKIPRPFYDRLRSDESAGVKALFDETLNTLLAANPEKRLVRTLDGNMRSFHSDRFRPYDNYELAESILPALPSAGAEVVSCEVTEKKFYLKVISPRITFEVKKGDIVQAGLVISNSEVGAGSLKVEPLIHRLVCLNGMISEDSSFRKIHAGKSMGQGGELAVEFYADDTRRQTDRAVFLQIRDVVQATLTQDGFKRIVEKFAASQQDKIEGNPFDVIEVVQEKFNLRENEKQGVLAHLIQGQDLNKFGLVNAFTRYAQDVSDYDRATDFERMGGQVLELKPSEWKTIAEATA